LADDNDNIIDVCGRMLKQLGYQVLTADSGKKILNHISNPIDFTKAPKLVILDMIMPDMASENIICDLKKIDPNIKILLAGGHSINGQATNLLEKGCDGFIQKPFDMETLSTKIRKLLDSTQTEII